MTRLSIHIRRVVAALTLLCLASRTVDGDEDDGVNYWGYYTTEDACLGSSEDAVAFHHGTCVLTQDRQIRCFGYMLSPVLAFTQGFGDVSVGDQRSQTGNALVPVFLSDVENAVTPTKFATTGSVNVQHMCAIMSNERIKCWGEGAWGALGHGSHLSVPLDHTIEEVTTAMGDNLPFIDLGSNAHVSKVVVGEHFTCALLKDVGRVKCWGDMENVCGGLADCEEDAVYGDHPGEVPDDTYDAIDFGDSSLVVEDIVAGKDFACALFDDGDVRCWGGNGRGQLGTESDESVSMRSVVGENRTVDVGSNVHVTHLAALSQSVCAILSDESVKCWGSNDFGALGAGLASGSSGTSEVGLHANEMGDNLNEVNLALSSPPIFIAGGGSSACVISQEKELHCWGSNLYGQIGVGGDMLSVGDDSPHAISRVNLAGGASSVTIGSDHICAILNETSDLYCWGSNRFGELGVGISNDTLNEPNDAPVDTGCEVFRCTEPSNVQHVTRRCDIGRNGTRGGDTVIANCTTPGVSEWVSTECVSGSSGELGEDTILTNCSEPTITNVSVAEWVEETCVSGDVNHVGVDTMISACSAPSEIEFVDTACETGHATLLGTDTIIKDCAEPISGEYVSIACVPGHALVVGADTVITLCNIPVDGVSFVSSTCRSGQPNATGTQSIISVCTTAEEGQWIDVPCASGSPSTLGRDSNVTQCAEPAMEGEWVRTRCIAGVPGHAGNNTDIRACREPIFDVFDGTTWTYEYVVSFCETGSSAIEGHDTVFQSCTEPTYNADVATCDVGSPEYVCEYVSQTCVPGTVSSVGVNTIVESCVYPGQNEIVNPVNPCVPGTPAQVGDSGSVVSAGACPPGMGMLYPATIFSQIVCEFCVNETFSPETSVERCQPWSTCPVGYGLRSNGSDYADRECDLCDQDEFSDVDDGSPCRPWRTCPPGFGLTLAGTPSSDRVCEACPVGTFSVSDDATPCETWRTCPEGFGLLVEGNASRDRTCEECVNETYSDVDDGSTCRDLTVCYAGTFQRINGSSVRNRQCEECPNGRFSESSGMSDCVLWKTCGIGFGLAPGGGGTPTRDRICEECPDGFESLEDSAAECVEIQTYTFVYILVAGIVLCCCIMFGYRQYRKWKYAQYIAEKKSRIKPTKKKKRRRKKKKKDGDDGNSTSSKVAPE